MRFKKPINIKSNEVISMTAQFSNSEGIQSICACCSKVIQKPINIIKIGKTFYGVCASKKCHMLLTLEKAGQ